MEPKLLVLLHLWFTLIHTVDQLSISVPHPCWVNVGDSVTLSCQEDEQFSPNNSFTWYRYPNVVLEDNYFLFDIDDKIASMELLADWQRGAGGSHSLGPVDLGHTGLYVCRVTDNENSTGHIAYRPAYVAGPSPSASLSVSPNSVQHITGEYVTLRCEEDRHSTGWRVKRITSRGMSECGTDWGSATGSTCTFRAVQHLRVDDNGVYWCESDSGVHSQAVNISVIYYHHVFLEIPALPVTEGHAVTLRCRHIMLPSNGTAEFYKDESLISTERSGEMKIPSVSASDEGQYHCRIPDQDDESIRSWMSVRAPTPSLPPPPCPAPIMSWSRLLCSVVVSSPYLLTTIILVAYCWDKTAEAHPKRVRRSQEVSSDQVICIQMT